MQFAMDFNFVKDEDLHVASKQLSTIGMKSAHETHGLHNL